MGENASSSSSSSDVSGDDKRTVSGVFTVFVPVALLALSFRLSRGVTEFVTVLDEFREVVVVVFLRGVVVAAVVVVVVVFHR